MDSNRPQGYICKRCSCRPVLVGIIALATFGFARAVAAAPADSGATTTAPSAALSPQSSTELQEINLEAGLEDIDLLTMEVPTVVTASRREQRINTVPYAMSVITHEEISAAGARTVTDALRLVPGVNVADLSYASSAVNVRGPAALLSRELLVLVDGRQIFDSLFGGTPWPIWPFQLEDIERIEVIRGPAPVTWGANAVNGVINIITKDPKDQLGLTVEGNGGSRGSNKEHAGYAFEDGKLRMRISGEYEGSDGFDRGGSLLRKLDDFYQAGRTNVYAMYDATPKDKLTLSGGNAVIRGGIPPAPGTSFFERRRADGQASYVLGRWDHTVASDNRFSLSAFVNDSYECPGASQIQYRYDQFGLQFGHTFKPAEHHTLTWGIDTRADYLDASYSDPFMLSKNFLGTGILGAYVQDEWQFAPRWRLTLGGRIDYDFYGGFQPSSRVSLSYDLNENSIIYGAISRAFQMPPLGSRFLDVPLSDGLAYATSQRSVEPEKLIAYEVGYRGKPLANLDVGAAIFCHSYYDMSSMRMLLGPPGLVQSRFMNSYDSTIYGVELDARYAVTKQLTLLGNYTFEREDDRGGSVFDQDDFMALPRHKFMIGSLYRPIDRVLLSSFLYYVGDSTAPDPAFPTPFTNLRIDDYFRLDLRAEYEFWKDRGSVAVGVRNLLDPEHPEGASSFQNFAEVPRMVYAEMRLVFK